jgi:hypothetical protein
MASGISNRQITDIAEVYGGSADENRTRPVQMTTTHRGLQQLGHNDLWMPACIRSSGTTQQSRDSTMLAFHGSVSRLHHGTYAPAIVITDVTTGKRSKIKLVAHFAEKEKARDQARERAAIARAYCRMSLPGFAY